MDPSPELGGSEPPDPPGLSLSILLKLLVRVTHLPDEHQRVSTKIDPRRKKVVIVFERGEIQITRTLLSKLHVYLE